MPRYRRLTNEDIRPADAPIPRDVARKLLVDYLVMAIGWPRPVAETAAEPYDWMADEHDSRIDDRFEEATSNPSLEVEMGEDEVRDLREELGRAANPREIKALETELAKAEKGLARWKAAIEKAEAKRAAAKGDYRKLLLKAARKIVSEEEKM